MLIQPVDFMRCALSLAKLALGYTSPNPAVGAIVVKDNVIVGMGYTQPPGSAHAEVMALRQAGDKAQGATMYVTLEPCSHYGRTPPCVVAIKNAGIADIHVAMVDPNPVVAGSGLEALKKASIEVSVGEYADEARQLNEAYIKYITTRIPYVTAKFAMSLDGKIATRTGDSKWISNGEARRYVHNLRQNVDAIMVGANTVIADNPRLTVRGICGKGGRSRQQPLRVIVDGKGRTTVSSQVFRQPGKTMVVLAAPLSQSKRAKFEKVGAEVIEIASDDAKMDLGELLRELGRRDVTHVLVEGGSELLGHLFDEHMVDKMVVFVAPIIIGGRKATTAISGLGVSSVAEALRVNKAKCEFIGDNLMVSGYLDRL